MTDRALVEKKLALIESCLRELGDLQSFVEQVRARLAGRA